MAERIQVNFGWLNDYSGAKFAPLTLADKILMSNQDKTFEDYIEDNFDSYKARLDAAEKDIDNLEGASKAVHDPLNKVTVPEDQNWSRLMFDTFGANYLVNFDNIGGYYVIEDSDLDQQGKVTNEAKERILHNYGLSAGLDEENGVVAPIYFKDGAPRIHAQMTGDLYPVNDRLLYIKEGDSLKPEWSRLEDFSNLNIDLLDASDSNKTTFRVEDSKNNNTGLNVNIKGNARTSSVALHSLQSTLSEYSYNAAIAKSARKLDYDIRFSNDSCDTVENKEVPFEAGKSHITGLLQFNNTNYDDGTTEIQTGLRLINILNTDGTAMYPPTDDGPQTIMGDNAGTYGASQTANYDTAERLSVFNVPDITVDRTGRVTNISQKAIRPGLNVQTLQAFQTEYGNATARAAVIGYIGGESPTFVHAGALDNTGIYIDWSQGIDKAILMGAAWNDYAEYRNQVEAIPAGYCVASQDDGKVYKTTEKFQACDGIVSDTYGFSIGQTENSQTPLAVSGRVLAYCAGDIADYHAGDTVCAGPEGKIYKMTREEIREWPDRIVGVVSEIPTYDYWNGTIPTKGRIWIKVK